MDGRRIMNECPAVIGMITSTVQSGGSIESAIRTVASSGPEHSRELFGRAVRLADTKGCASLVDGLRDVLSDLPKEANGYGRAVLMSVSASESSDPFTRDRMLRDAADIALDSVREMGESYGSSLTTPCMTVFGLGIMVPMILMSILPMLTVGGMFGSKTIDQGTVVLTTLVIIPAVILAVAVYVRDRNPFLSERTRLSDIRMALPLLLAIPLAIAYTVISDDTDGLFICSLAPACVCTVFLTMDAIRRDSKRRRCELSLMDTVFDLGNRMLSGVNFETAAVDSMDSSKECHELSERLSREFALSRGDLDAAIDSTVSPVSAEMSTAMRNILICSERDSDDAGKLAVTLGKQFQNRNLARRSLEMKLKSTTDMMIGTAMVFAPMVLGMSVAMLRPLSKIADYSAMEDTSLVLGAYLIELCALIAILVSSLGNGEGTSRMVWRFCLMCPVSLLVYAACCSISLRCQ
jgi:hypothetical protein